MACGLYRGGHCLHGTHEIINSDQGGQFTSDIYTDCLKSHEIRISMDGRGRAIDNIFIERFWRSFKHEKIYLEPSDNGMKSYHKIKKYIEFYNRERPHRPLGYKTPEEMFRAAKKLTYLRVITVQGTGEVKAFNRYMQIDEDMKKELVKYLD